MKTLQCMQSSLVLSLSLVFLGGSSAYAQMESFHSFESSNFPGYYIHHAPDGFYIGPITNDADKIFTEFAWNVSPFQKKEDQTQGNFLIFLNPLNAQQYYMRNLNGKITIALSDDSKEFFDQASFYSRKGLTQTEPHWNGVNDGALVSFESAKYPGHYIRHSNYRLYLQPYDGTELFRKDATFIFRWAEHKGPLPLDVYNNERARITQLAQPQLAQAQEQQRLAQQRAQEEQQRVAQERAREEQRILDQQRAQQEQQRIAQQQQQQQYRDKTFTVQIDCKGYSTLTNTGTNDQITVSFVNKDGTKLVDGNSTKVINNCDLDTYISMTSAQLMNEVVAVQIITSGSDGFWMDRVLLHVDNQEIAHWGANEGKGYCLSHDPADGDGSWKDFVGARGCQPCFRFDVASGQVVACQ
ncbi:MAG: AbfB domain-containing protein [Cyclobacteriaceae bacterium]